MPIIIEATERLKLLKNDGSRIIFIVRFIHKPVTEYASTTHCEVESMIRLYS